jgi:uncharacterized protein YcbX
VSSPRVAALSLTAVKGTRLVEVDAVRLEAAGAVGDRRFFVIDERNRMVNGKILGQLQQIVASASADRLRLELPDGSVAEAPVELGATVQTRFFSRPREAREVIGPFAASISAQCGQPLRLVEDAHGAVDRGAAAGVSLVSSASLRRLAREAEVDVVDGRRFRMLVEIDGVEAHEEDAWVGRTVRIGDARVRFGGHVGRCLVTSRHPEHGVVDLPTLELLRGYRAANHLESTEPLPFGVYGQVKSPGEVRLGDPVSVE